MTPKPHPQPSEDAGPKLLPCPFCGPGRSIVDLYFDDTSKRFRVGCGRCGCSTGISPTDKSEAPAISAWNTRASPAPTGDSEALADKKISALVDDIMVEATTAEHDGFTKRSRVFDLVVAALRQPPQPTGDVGEPPTVIEDYANFAVLNELDAVLTKVNAGYAPVVSRDLLNDLRTALIRADSRIGQLDHECQASMAEIAAGRDRAEAAELYGRERTQLAEAQRRRAEAAEQSLRTATEALNAAHYYINALERVARGRPVRDLDEAEQAFVRANTTARAALTGAGEK